MLRTGEKFNGAEVVNPFSEAFEEKWKMWLYYKKECHKFEYKSAISEQAALNQLVDLSEGDEEHAARILNQSMANNWKGLFKVHNPKKDKNVKSTTEKTTKSGNPSTNELKVAFAKRNGTEG
jgi:flagellar hook-associated protein FlgK